MKPLLLIMAVLGLGGLLFVQWGIAPALPPTLSVRPAAPQAPGSAERSLETFAMPLKNKAVYAVIDQRPVFVQDRKPLEPAGTAVTAPEDPVGTDSLDYNGVLITRKGKLALILDTQTGKFTRLTLGERINGWTVQDIAEQRLRLSNGSKKVEIPLRIFEPVVPIPPVAMPASEQPPEQTQATPEQPPEQIPVPDMQRQAERIPPRQFPHGRRLPRPPTPEGDQPR